MFSFTHIPQLYEWAADSIRRLWSKFKRQYYANLVYTLYYCPSSVHSLMRRLAIQFAHELGSLETRMMRLKVVNMFRHENLLQDYLEMNPRGLVSCVEGSSKKKITNGKDLTGIMEILEWLCKRVPELYPGEHQDTIDSLFNQLFKFNFQVLARDGSEFRTSQYDQP